MPISRANPSRHDFVLGSCVWCTSRSPPPPDTRLRREFVGSPGRTPWAVSSFGFVRSCWLLPGPPCERSAAAVFLLDAIVDDPAALNDPADSPDGSCSG